MTAQAPEQNLNPEPLQDDDSRTLKNNLASTFQTIVEYVSSANTANPAVLDLVQSCVDGLDAVFEAVTGRFEVLPESVDSKEPDYSAELQQNDDLSKSREMELGAMIIAKALDIKVPDFVQITLEPTKSSQWTATWNSFVDECRTARKAITNGERINFFVSAGLAVASLEEALTVVQNIMPDSSTKQWKKTLDSLRGELAKASRSIKPGARCSNARLFIKKLVECCVTIQENVSFQEKATQDYTNRLSILLRDRG